MYRISKYFFVLNTTKKTRFIDKGHAHLKKLFSVYTMEDNPISKKTESKIYKYLNEISLLKKKLPHLN